MNIIKTAELRSKVQDALDFDRKHSKLISESSGQFTGNFSHETYEGFGFEMTYYFEGPDLYAYEHDVEKKRKESEEFLKEFFKTPAYREIVTKLYAK